MKPKNRCPECNSTQCYYRVKTNDFLCQKCGYIWVKNDSQKEVK